MKFILETLKPSADGICTCNLRVVKNDGTFLHRHTFQVPAGEVARGQVFMDVTNSGATSAVGRSGGGRR
jgi:hypothetical protein